MQTSYKCDMSFSIRLTDEGLRELDALTKEAGFKDRSETVRTALNLLATVLADARFGMVTVSMPQEKARELGMVRPLVTPSIR